MYLIKGCEMTSKQCKKHFGSISKIADALGISRQSVDRWGERPPMRRQYELQIITLGQLKSDPFEVKR
jgi:DNA invertase Pin-like site-specific DNA recombinase